MRLAIFAAVAAVSITTSASAATVAVDYDALASVANSGSGGFSYAIPLTGPNGRKSRGGLSAAGNSQSGLVLTVQGDFADGTGGDTEVGDIVLTISAGRGRGAAGASTEGGTQLTFLDTSSASAVYALLLDVDGGPRNLGQLVSLIGIGQALRIQLGNSGGGGPSTPPAGPPGGTPNVPAAGPPAFTPPLIDVGGPGGPDPIGASVVPLPATLPLLLAALASLSLLGWRRSRTA